VATLKQDKIGARVREVLGWCDLSPDGKLLSVGSRLGAAHLCDVEGGGRLAVLVRHSGQTSGGAFSPDGKLLASGGEEGRVSLWDVEAIRMRKGPVIWIGEPPK
jgi:WD40 repeat protein